MNAASHIAEAERLLRYCAEVSKSALTDAEVADVQNVSVATAQVHALLALAAALLPVQDHLERIDDALRNTVGGRP